MNTDRKLLELAAKAAGHRIVEWVRDGNGVDVAIIVRADGDGFSKRLWQPLHENQITDSDGDALRLAVRLCMSVTNTTKRTSILARPDPEFGDWIADSEPHFDDPYAATRRAIVRAAAEIGRSMT